MDQLIPSLAALVEAFRDCFHPQVFPTFQALIAGWIVCLGPRTISEVWQATGLAAKRHHDTAYAVFHSAAWEWDDLGIVLATLILTHLVPGGVVWVAVDDTLCHKRGAKVAFGGIFLDAVLSSKRHKTFRFGLNWVVLGIAVPIPFRPDRYFCLPVLWRLYRKKGQPGYQTRPQAAAALARKLAEANPERTFWLVGDSAYVNAAVLQGRPANLQVIGPLHWKAALYERPAPRQPKQKGRLAQEGGPPAEPQGDDRGHGDLPRRAADDRLPEADAGAAGAGDPRRALVPREQDRAGDGGAGPRPVGPVAGRGAGGDRPDGLGGVRDPGILPEMECGTGVLRQQAVPRAARPAGAERAERGAAHPMAWFVGSLTILWYCVKGHEGSHVERDRPWYEDEGDADVHGHAGCITVADVGVRDLWRVW